MDNASATTGQAKLNESVVSTLQDLSARAHDSELGYRRSAEDAKDSDLKQQFEQLANERSSMAAELDRLIREHGGEPSWSGGSMAGAAHRMFTDLKAAISGNQRQAILTEVARGESVAEEAYDEALRQNLPEDIKQIVRQQHRRVRETRNRYRAMSGAGSATQRTGEMLQRSVSGAASYTGETVSHYMVERPVMSSLVIFALGFVIGALVVSMQSDQRQSGQSGHRYYG